MNQDERDDETGGEGGIAGGIHFRYQDAMSIAPRDDVLPPHEIKRLLLLHKELHKEYVVKQKLERQNRKKLKAEGKTLSAARGYGAGQRSVVRDHPLLSKKAQFSGADRQVTPDPKANMANTNEGQQNELQLRFAPQPQLQNRNELRHQKSLTPTLRRG